MDLILGTAAFGMDYGATNLGGRVPAGEAVGILRLAADSGFVAADTAPAYGEAEAVVGRALAEGARLDVITKTAPWTGDAAVLEAGVRASLERLGVASVSTLLVHRADDLLGPGGDACWEALSRLRDGGVTEGLGASVYEPGEAAAIAERYPVDVIQGPLNLLDRRFIEGGTVAELVARAIAFHARSPFLQGVLLADPDGLPARFEGVKERLRDFRQRLAGSGVTAMQAALGFVVAQPGVRAVVCGATTRAELREIAGARPFALPAGLADGLASDDLSVIDPRAWARD